MARTSLSPRALAVVALLATACVAPDPAVAQAPAPVLVHAPPTAVARAYCAFTPTPDAQVHCVRDLRDAVARAQLTPATIRLAAVQTGELAQLRCDSTCAADTTAIVRGLYKFKGPGKSWGVLPLALGAGMIDRHPPDGVPLRWTGIDKQAHALGGAALSLTIDAANGPGGTARAIAWACGAEVVREIGQMRPSGFPKAGLQTLGVFDYRDPVLGCSGAIAAPLVVRLLQRF